MCDAGYFFGFDDPNSESTQACDIFWAVSGADSAPIFIIVPIQDVVAAILYCPMAAVNGEETFWVCFVDRSTGDAVGDFTGALATLFLCEVAFNGEGLPDMGKVEVVVELGGGPDLSDFDSSMVRRRTLDEVRLLAIFEPEGNIFEKGALVCFDGEMIMGMTLRDQILRDLALSQQGIGRHILARDIDGVQQGDGHVDFVRAFGLFMVAYGQGANFFWA